MSDLNAKIDQLLIILAEKQECFRIASHDDKVTLQPEIDGLQSDLQYLETQAEQIQARKLAAFRRLQNHTRPHRVHQLDMIHKEARQLFENKNKDYGDAFAKFGVIGVLMRIEDKIQRAISVDKNKVILVNDETIKDTLIDLHNYAAMGLMLLDEE